MRPAFEAIESVDRRMLAALQFVHAVSNAPLSDRFVVRSPGTRWTRADGGHHVLLEAPGLEEYACSFVTPDEPGLESILVEADVTDRSGRYLARRVTVRLPRSAKQSDRDKETSVFKAVPVRMFPAPVSRARPGWAVVRGCVQPRGGGDGCGEGKGLAGALLVVRDGADEVRGRGLSDANGQFLLAVAGIPVRNWPNVDDDAGGAAAGPVVVPHLDVTVAVLHDPGAEGLPDPDDLETRAAADEALVVREHQIKLVSGREQTETL